ncbi:MAG: type II secretion system F family protein [Acidimicrobiia bacterium]|nr:type II secretion system F family protein [Acidimicrobiia bacterium]
MGVVLTATIACAGFVASGLLARSASKVGAATRAGGLRTATRSRIPARLRAPLKSRLEAAGVAATPEGAVQTWLVAVLAAGLLGVGMAPAVAVAAVLVALGAGPVWLHLSRHRRDRRAGAAVPELLDAVATELRGGATVESAIASGAAGGGPLAPDLLRVAERVSLGSRLGDALASWAVERDVGGVRPAAGALALAAEVGGPAAGALEGLAPSLRQGLAASAEARSLSAQARLSAVVVGAGPAGFLALSAAADPRRRRRPSRRLRAGPASQPGWRWRPWA